MSTATLTNIDAAVLSVLKYYSLFHYPITMAELYGNCSVRCSNELVKEAIGELKEKRVVFEYKGYYSILSDIEVHVDKRIAGNTIAREKEKQAEKCGRLISKFPFVRFVGISGSLSKGYAEKDSDFDFFVVTERNRLWTARTLLHIFKKLTFIFGKQHRFCMNYFVDQAVLTIPEQNIFTAIELASMIPVYGDEEYAELMQANGWLQEHFPNGFKRFCENEQVVGGNSSIKNIAEKILNVLYPNETNGWLMRITDRRWRKKWSRKQFPMEDYDLAFKTTIHVSKNHPRNHQKKTLSLLRKLDQKDA